MRTRLTKNVEDMLKIKVQKLKQQRGKVILKMADVSSAEQRNNRVQTRLKEAVRKDLAQRRAGDVKNTSESTMRPGPKEFFLKAIVNKLLVKRGNTMGMRDSRQFWKQMGMPKQTCSKLTVNKIIKKIRLVRERQNIRQTKRKINQQILTFGRKTLVVR